MADSCRNVSVRLVPHTWYDPVHWIVGVSQAAFLGGYHGESYSCGIEE